MRKNISTLLKKYRLQNGLTQEELANKIFVHRTTYTKWETGHSEIPFSKLKSYINSLNLTNEEILELTEKAKSESAGESYIKIIHYYKSVLMFAFDQCFMEYLLIAEGKETPFNELDDEFKEWYRTELGKEITEKDYLTYYSWYMREILEEDHYKAFENVLVNNPFCQVLFQFKLFGTDYYKNYWQRFKNEYNEPYNLQFDEKETTENISKIIDTINQPHLNFSYSTNDFFPMTKKIKINREGQPN